MTGVNLLSGGKMEKLFGILEAGGTKFICAVGTGPGDIRDEERFPTTTPDETLSRTLDYFRRMENRHGKLSALGIGSFGPLDLNPQSATWGFITATPKPGWSNTSLASFLSESLGVPAFIDTDVNAAALAESLWGAGTGLKNLVYVTVGTGIGGGVLSGGNLIHGLVHPELGHILLPKRGDDAFEGNCPFHRTCLEGLASGPAIQKRWGIGGGNLPPHHPAWDLEAHYLALGLQSWTLSLSPEKIILGGGVMAQEHLLPLIQTKLLKLLGGYIQHPLLTQERIGEYVCAPGLGTRSGLMGALALAMGLH